MSPKADPDAALMLAFQRGNESAFTTLVERHRARVLRLAFRYLGNEAAAEDLAQEAFLRVYRTKATWEPRAKFSTWLYRVTANACLNELRARRARKAVEATAPSGPSGAALPEGEDRAAISPPDAVLVEERAVRVREAVAGLPEDQRLAVLLNKFEGLSYRELAEAMGRSVPAVKSLLVRARENLRTVLEPYLAGAPGGDEDEPLSPTDRLRKERQAARRAGAAGRMGPESGTKPEEESTKP